MTLQVKLNYLRSTLRIWGYILLGLLVNPAVGILFCLAEVIGMLQVRQYPVVEMKIDKNYCPQCDAFLPGEAHKPMCPEH
jgi:hypothetical protein